jgi:hypothetical protein
MRAGLDDDRPGMAGRPVPDPFPKERRHV